MGEKKIGKAEEAAVAVVTCACPACRRVAHAPAGTLVVCEKCGQAFLASAAGAGSAGPGNGVEGG